ncbi:MAG TPA: hypothetical protein VM052_05640 [Candidatus Limnocylindrales bacterium]|nr:hypothetical protein [Candidatus Limnocylindrales bacterium]
MGMLLAIVIAVGSVIAPNTPATATAPVGAVCASSTGPGIPPPARVPAGIPGFHASWYGQSGYMNLCPGERATAIVAYYNSGSRGWIQGRMGEAAYLGSWDVEPGQDQPSILGGDGQLGTPTTGWPRYNRPAVQPATWVGPGQVAWFQFAVQAPLRPGTYRLGVRPLVEGATWMEDYGVFWEITVLNPDGSVPLATPSSPAGFYFSTGTGVAAKDINALHEGVEWASRYLATSAGGDRTKRATARIIVGDGTARFCCLTSGPSFDIVTSNTAWSAPQAAAPDTWTADDERAELAAHEYVHVWQYDIGGTACMLGPRWISEGMAESLAYRAMITSARITAANLDVFTKRQLRSARYVTLRSLESDWPGDANPFAAAYLAVDRLLAVPSPVALRTFCSRVGAGEAWRTAFAAAFGVDIDTFYARYEAYRAEYVR